MKKLFAILLMTAFVAGLKKKGEKTPARSIYDRADRKREVFEKTESFLENAYYAIAVCALRCKDLVSAIFS